MGGRLGIVQDGKWACLAFLSSRTAVRSPGDLRYDGGSPLVPWGSKFSAKYSAPPHSSSLVQSGLILLRAGLGMVAGGVALTGAGEMSVAARLGLMACFSGVK